jgi:hypothetical protein
MEPKFVRGFRGDGLRFWWSGLIKGANVQTPGGAGYTDFDFQKA